MNYIETERLILRDFTEKDTNALFAILSDKDVNAFLPMFPLKTIEEAEKYLLYIENYVQQKGIYYAICLKDNDIPIGCIHVSADDSHDLGYSIGKSFWHKGVCTEACQAVVNMLRQTDIPYITATHDVNNPRSGRVMQAIGMKYKYSYEELWKPKNFLVTFRMYQLNLDGDENRVYKKYWNKYAVHFIEDLPYQ
ncbi:GNAT family N-acetyltransferase [Bacteroides finegoldii]|uniref:GNAT family N-acetyltransferase n=1 Tax=Bacteroides finegoldii TaxID=338188 RepID=UPI00189D85F4|nr:GNAT family N-acetyltransferase [Bacteroides finegoldii]